MKNIETNIWEGKKARGRFQGQRKMNQVGPGKFPTSWFNSLRDKQVLMDRSEVIPESEWPQEIFDHCVKKIPWLRVDDVELEELYRICEEEIDWSKQSGPPGKYIDIRYVQNHPIIDRFESTVKDHVGTAAQYPANFARIKPLTAMYPHRDSPLRWMTLYCPIPTPGAEYAPTEHLWEDGLIYGVKDWDFGAVYAFNQDIWHMANNYANAPRYTLQMVLDMQYEDFISNHT